MKATVYKTSGEKSSEIELPFQFSEPVREDLIKRAALAIRSGMRQPYGTDPEAGTRQGKPTSKRRHRYTTTYGRGWSRIRRKAMMHRGTQFQWVGAFVALAVKGRAAFPPTANREFAQKINKTENRKAIRSAIAATSVFDLVSKKHSVNGIKIFPIIIEHDFENLKKSKDVLHAFDKLGLAKEIERCSEKKIRAGKGKNRGRRYITKAGPLVVVSKSCDLQNAAASLPGVEVASVKSLNAYLLAPGAQAGRLTIWTKSAIETLGKERLFE
ncbi:MAG: 50S ribosomal protein L4 [DPANN group archaeon]|nr:50S ribosomal protein L4 [DPANN group archaeon]